MTSRQRTKRIRVGVVGVGRLGARRAAVAASHPRSELCVVADLLPDRARSVAEECGCESTTDWKEAATRSDLDLVVVSTPTKFLPEVAELALEAGKHVLCEKPFGPSADKVARAVEIAAWKSLCLKVGYNLRYHPALKKAHDLAQQGAVGQIQFIRCRYGHGGRWGYEREWRAQAELSGGGELLDQGVHALDLFQWFLPDFKEVVALLATTFWPISPLEDNAFVLLRSQSGGVASLHASWTNWKNIFSFEVFGEQGYLIVDGLGGSYGAERLCCGMRTALGAPPQEQVWEFSGEDTSLQQEWEDFLECVINNRDPQSSGREGWRTLKLVEAIYMAAERAQPVDLASDVEPVASARGGEGALGR